MRKTTASVLLLALAAVASISFEGAAAAAAEATETANPPTPSSSSPAPASPAPSPSTKEEGAADSSTDHSKHNHSHNAAAQAPAPAAQAPTPAAQLPDHPCFADPSASECANFTRPKGSWLPELTKLCEAMDYMPGCTLWRECQASNRNDGYCHHPSLVGTICTDMPRMKGCEPWNALCRKGSLVPHCSRPGPLPNAPSTAEATQSVQKMCSSHSMPGCEACGQGAAAGAEGCREPLAALAMVCAAMPGMRDCAQLAAACKGNASEAFPRTCMFASGGDKNKKKEKGSSSSAASLAGTDASSAAASSSYNLPPMRMFVHTDAEDIVLAKQWVPRSPGTVAAACLGSIGGGFLSQALRAARGAAEAAVAARLLRGGGGGGRRRGLFSSPSAGARLGRNALRAAATFASSLLDLLLMLVAMTFSWPLILSVAAGYGLGALVFGALGEPRVGRGGGRGGVGVGGGDGGDGDGEEFCDGGDGHGNGKPPAAAAATNGFATSEGVHLHGGTEGVDGASCCDMGGGIGRAKLSPTIGGNGNGNRGDAAASSKGRGGGWFGGKP